MSKRRRSMDYTKIIENIKENDKKPNYNHDDPNEYKIKTKDDGTASAILRFLPPPIDEDLPFVKIYNHGFRGHGDGWFVEACPTTIGNKCPVCKENSRIWDDDPDTARPRSRRLSYWANILVIYDPQTPENEGKVFKYRYGVKIHEKIMGKIAPEDAEMDQMIPVFDYELGANFKLKVTSKKVYFGGSERLMPNYDKSEFAEPTPIGMGKKAFTDAELDTLDENLNALAPIVADSQFKSYEELAQRFTKKTGISVPLSPDGDVIVKEEPVAKKTTVKEESVPEEDTPVEPVVEDTAPSKEEIAKDAENDDNFFKKLRSGE